MRTSRKLALSFALAAITAFSVPAMASADTITPGQSGGGFTGWTNQTVNDGLCIPAVTCPVVSYSTPATGGVGNTGHLRTSIIGLAAAGTVTQAHWISPQFAYTGNGGANPTSVTLDMFRRSDVAGLLGVGGAANYGVTLHDVTSAADVTVVPPTSQAGADNWTAIPTASVNPSQLVLGHVYQVVVTSTYTAPGTAQVLPMGNSDYDGVTLSTAGNAGGGGGNPYGTNPALSALAAQQACIRNAKKKVKKIKSKKARKKKLKKLIRDCRGSKKVVKKKKKKRRRR